MNLEQAKYEAMWRDHPQYRVNAPGEQLVDMFLSKADPKPHHKVLDFGCGTGRGAAEIARRTGATVTGVDFAANCLDEDVVGKIEFRQHDLTTPLGLERPYDYGYCTDVLEHIPPQDVDNVLANIVTAARRVFLCVSTRDDVFGALIGEPLHLTVQPMHWWLERLDKLGFTVSYSHEFGDNFVVFGSAWLTFSEVEHNEKLNVEEERVRQNIKGNLQLGLQEIVPHAVQDTEIMLLCGGPSLNDFADEIVRRNVEDNMPAVTVNGTYNWLLDHGGRPGVQVVVDAREFNRRFVEPVIPQCKYLISSQCDPSLAAGLPPAQTLLWHVAGAFVQGVLEEHAKESGVDREWFPIPGGTTVSLRAIPMLSMLGFKRIHVYGLDSCMRGRQHHAYDQPENDEEAATSILIDGREFRCSGWMMKQAHEFQELMKHILVPAGVELAVHGDGMIAAILQAAAAANEE